MELKLDSADVVLSAAYLTVTIPEARGCGALYIDSKPIEVSSDTRHWSGSRVHPGSRQHGPNSIFRPVRQSLRPQVCPFTFIIKQAFQ